MRVMDKVHVCFRLLQMVITLQTRFIPIKLYLCFFQRPMSPEQVERAFNHLMLESRVRSAVRLITDRWGGGVLDSSGDAYLTYCSTN